MEATNDGAESKTDVEEEETKPDVATTSEEAESSTHAIKADEECQQQQIEESVEKEGCEESALGENITTQNLPDPEMVEKVESLSVEEPVVDPAVIELITSGFVEKFLQNLRRSQATIDQVRSSQEVLLETVQQEVAKFRDCQSVKDVEDTMVKARHYHNKLLRLRREMSSLHEKSKKLKKKALKLQQQKQTEELTRAHTREHEMEKERMLTARLATSPSTT